jgi:hypothetical protein
MQSSGCALSVCALILWNEFFSEAEGMRILMLVLVICAGAIETIGAQLSRGAVKKEWVPIVLIKIATVMSESLFVQGWVYHQSV